MFLDKKDLPAPTLTVGSADAMPVPVPLDGGYAPPERADGPVETMDGPFVDVPLIKLAFARSGDKGNSSNVAIFARKPEYLPYLRKILTPEAVVAQLSPLVRGPAERFEAPGLHALNFLIQDALSGGGMASLRIDPQGKAYGQMVLEMIVPVPTAWGL